jgi:hypothetical protein
LANAKDKKEGKTKIVLGGAINDDNPFMAILVLLGKSN